MVVYAQSLRAEVSKCWNPSQTLGIINADTGTLTCNGYAPSQGRRCRNPIRAENRAFIERTLAEIASVSPDSSTVISKLQAIVGPALCVRWHQGQRMEVLSKWNSKIRGLKPQIKEPDHSKASHSIPPQRPSEDSEWDDLCSLMQEMKESMAKLQEETDGRRYRRSGLVEEQAPKPSQTRMNEAKTKEAGSIEAERRKTNRLESERVAEQQRQKEEQRRKAQAAAEERARVRAQEIRAELNRAKQRLEQAQKAKEERETREREQAAKNEQIRLRAEEIRKEKEQKLKEKWLQLWEDYQERWTQLKASGSVEGEFRNAVPWPVESGLYSDVNASNVKMFLQKTIGDQERPSFLYKKECFKWHPDSRRCWLKGSQLTDVEKMMIEMICRVVTELLPR